MVPSFLVLVTLCCKSKLKPCQTEMICSCNVQGSVLTVIAHSDEWCVSHQRGVCALAGQSPGNMLLPKLLFFYIGGFFFSFWI